MSSFKCRMCDKIFEIRNGEELGQRDFLSYDKEFYICQKCIKRIMLKDEIRDCEDDHKKGERYEVYGFEQGYIMDYKEGAINATSYTCRVLNEFDNKITDLEAKLAEKEKENAKLKQVVETIDKLKQYDLDMGDYCLISQKYAEQYFNDTNQDKIELLEKVLNKLISIYECIYSQHYDFALIEIEKFIKEIKGE